MLHSHDRGHGQAHDHGQAHEYGHGHGHAHGPSSPHPSQTVPWSILRMALVARLGAALAVSAGLWAAVVVALK